MKYLIVSADDLGITKSVNEGIVKAYKDGIVTSLNLLPSGEALENGLDLIKKAGIDEAGVHLALTETVPLSKPGEIPTIAAKDGRFPKNRNDLLLKLVTGRVNLDEVYVEFKRQLDRSKMAGVRLTNLSGHEHIHMMPQILKIFVALSKEYGIPAIRYPRREAFLAPLGLKKIYRSLMLSFFEKGMADTLRTSGIVYTDNFGGFLDSGSMGMESLIGVLRSLKEGVTELVFHPGFIGPEVLGRYRFHLKCEEELSALTSPAARRVIEDSGIKLISYREFLTMKKA